jgi:hypothetical protein
LILTVALCLPAAALAVGPNYSFVEAGYIDVDVDVDTVDLDGIDDSGDGWFVGGSFGSKRWHIFGEYQEGDLGSGASKLDQERWFVGAGWHGLLGERADLVVEVAYLDVGFDVGDSKVSDDGFRGSAGVRWVPVKLFELNGFYNYADLSDLRTADESWEVNAILNIWRIGLGLGYEEFDDTEDLRAFVRFNF